jgi:beta-lactamase superfamily II metal-dependent hydrolase
MLRFAVVVLLLFVSASGSLAAQEQVSASNRVTNFVHIRNAPDGSGEKGQLHRGESLPLVADVPRWYEVRLPDGSTGFVSKAWTTIVRGLAPRQEDDLRIHFLNIGTGTCTVIQCPGANAPPMIVDCGSTGAAVDDLSADETKSYVDTILGQHSTRPNAVLSHADLDHYSHIPSVLDSVTAQHIWMGGTAADYSSAAFPTWLDGQRKSGAHDHTDLQQHFHNNRQPIGSHLSCGLANAYVLTVNSGTSKNAQSLVLMLEYGDFTAIFTGDAEGETEAQAMRNYGDTLKAVVLSASHHGASTHTSNSADWARTVAPSVLVSSAGSKFFHPRCIAVDRFTSTADVMQHSVQCGSSTAYQKSRITKAHYVTAVNGAVVITTGGRSPLTVHCTGSTECDIQIPYE